MSNGYNGHMVNNNNKTVGFCFTSFEARKASGGILAIFWRIFVNFISNLDHLITITLILKKGRNKARELGRERDRERKCYFLMLCY